MAVRDAAVDLFRDFGSRHPNLTPALYAQGESATGASIAAVNPQDFLAFALGMQHKYRGQDLNTLTDYRRFVSERPTPRGQPVSAEIWCPAEPVAKTIIRQAGIAATRLAWMPGVRAAYDPMVEFVDNNAISAMEEVLHEIADSSAAAHARGELA